MLSFREGRSIQEMSYGRSWTLPRVPALITDEDIYAHSGPCRCMDNAWFGWDYLLPKDVHTYSTIAVLLNKRKIPSFASFNHWCLSLLPFLLALVILRHSSLASNAEYYAFRLNFLLSAIRDNKFIFWNNFSQVQCSKLSECETRLMPQQKQSDSHGHPCFCIFYFW